MKKDEINTEVCRIDNSPRDAKPDKFIPLLHINLQDSPKILIAAVAFVRSS